MTDARTGEPAFLVNAVRQAAERSSIRDVASQSGLSHGGLHNLINDKTDRINGATIRKLRAWYLRQWATGGDSLTPDIAEYVLVEQVLAPIPANVRASAALELVLALERIYDSHGAPRPAWLSAVRNKC
jgi:hypothetical protein